MNRFAFNPTTGYSNASSFPDPTSSAQTREQIQRLHSQTRDYINNVIDPAIEAIQATTFNQTAYNNLTNAISGARLQRVQITIPADASSYTYSGTYATRGFFWQLPLTIPGFTANTVAHLTLNSWNNIVGKVLITTDAGKAYLYFSTIPPISSNVSAYLTYQTIS